MASERAATRPDRARPTAAIRSPKRAASSATVTGSAAPAGLRRAHQRYVEVLDLLAQSVAIEPEKTGSPQLVPAGCPQGQCQQRPLDFGQNAVVQAIRWQALAMG